MSKYRITEHDGRYYAEVRELWWWSRLSRLVEFSVPPRWADIGFSSEQQARQAIELHRERKAKESIKPTVVWKD